MNAGVNRIIYLGDDAAYVRVLSTEIKRLQGATPVKFEQVFESQPKRIQGLLPRVLELAPSIVIVDFSKQTDDYVHLARLLIRTNTLKPFTVIGLHDYLSPPEQVKESFLAGVNMNFIKSAEVFDPAFAALTMLDPTKKREHGFATADIAEERTVFHLCKAGFIDHQGLHFETNLSLTRGEELRIRTQWNTPKLVPSTLMKVRETSSSMLFYHFRQAVDADFAWVDPVVIVEGDPQDRIRELKAEHEHNVSKAQKQLKNWLEGNIDRSQNKSVRVLVVDRQHSFYQDRERSDKYGYAIRCQPFLLDVAQELEAQRPQVIAVALDIKTEEDAKKEVQGPANDLALVRSLADFCRARMLDHPPYIVVFNLVGVNSKDLQQQLGYANSMAFSGELTPEVLLKMAAVFADKLAQAKESAKTPADRKAKESPVVFIKKSNPMSIIEVEQAIQLEKLSETDAVFSCNRELPMGTVLHFREPIEGYLTVVPNAQYKHPSYYSILNGVGEIGKKELRVIVNSFFFKDHDAEKLVELEAYQQLNQAKLEERLKAEAAAQKAAEEAAAKAAAEAAEAAKVASANPEANPDLPVEEVKKQA